MVQALNMIGVDYACLGVSLYNSNTLIRLPY